MRPTRDAMQEKTNSACPGSASCVCVCVCLSVSVSVSLCLSVCLCLSVSVCVCVRACEAAEGVSVWGTVGSAVLSCLSEPRGQGFDVLGTLRHRRRRKVARLPLRISRLSRSTDKTVMNTVKQCPSQQTSTRVESSSTPRREIHLYELPPPPPSRTNWTRLVPLPSQIHQSPQRGEASPPLGCAPRGAARPISTG